MSEVKSMSLFGAPKENIDLIAMDRLYSGENSPYNNTLSGEEIGDIIDDVLNFFRLMKPEELSKISEHSIKAIYGRRQDPNVLLTDLEIEYIKGEILEIEAEVINKFGEELFVFNEGLPLTYYDDDADIIFIRKNIFPDYKSLNHYDLVSVRAVLAHEFWGHRFLKIEDEKNNTNYSGISGSAADESLASAVASRAASGLRKLDKMQLAREAEFRLKKLIEETNVSIIDKLLYYDKVDQEGMKSLLKKYGK